MLSEMFSASDTRWDPSLFVCSGGGLTGSDKKPDADSQTLRWDDRFSTEEEVCRFQNKGQGVLRKQRSSCAGVKRIHPVQHLNVWQLFYCTEDDDIQKRGVSWCLRVNEEKYFTFNNSSVPSGGRWAEFLGASEDRRVSDVLGGWAPVFILHLAGCEDLII